MQISATRCRSNYDDARPAECETIIVLQWKGQSVSQSVRQSDKTNGSISIFAEFFSRAFESGKLRRMRKARESRFGILPPKCHSKKVHFWNNPDEKLKQLQIKKVRHEHVGPRDGHEVVGANVSNEVVGGKVGNDRHKTVEPRALLFLRRRMPNRSGNILQLLSRGRILQRLVHQRRRVNGSQTRRSRTLPSVPDRVSNRRRPHSDREPRHPTRRTCHTGSSSGRAAGKSADVPRLSRSFQVRNVCQLRHLSGLQFTVIITFILQRKDEILLS